MIPQHSSATQEHPTPADVVDAARDVLGRIDLDPATTRAFNTTVKACRVLSRNDDGVDGLVAPWWGTVFLNPPGGTFTARRKSASDPPVETSAADIAARERWQTNSRAVAWWRKLMREQARADGVTSAIFVGFTLEILSSAQHIDWPSPMHFPFCVPSERLRFGGEQPTHANVIVYTGENVEHFADIFGRFGLVKT